jgi:hypothetical protein
MYFCKNCATCGTLKRELIIIHPKIAYETIRPSVYANPEINTSAGWTIFFDKKEIAATLEAKGHGLMDVRIPNHKADKKPNNISVIELLLVD